MKAPPAGENDSRGRCGCVAEDMNRPSRQLRAKYRTAQEAGLLGRVLEVGWAGLSAKESGRIGGILAHMDQEKA